MPASTIAGRFMHMAQSYIFMGQEGEMVNKSQLSQFSSDFLHLSLKWIPFMCRLEAHVDDNRAFRGHGAILCFMGQGGEVVNKS